MNPLGLHALVWTGQWTPESARYAIESTKRIGFDLIEIPILEPEHFDIGMTRQLLADNDLQAACSLGLSEDTDVSSPDPVIVARGRDRLAAAVDVAAGIGAGNLCGVLYSRLGKYPEPLSPAGRENVLASIAWLGERTAQAGLPTSLEVVNRYETNVVNTVADMVVLLDEAGVDLGVHLDTYHANIEENGFFEPVTAAGDRLGYVHIGESHRGYLGTGTIDFATFFTALKASGYSGPVTFESFSSAVVHPELSNLLAVWRNLWDDSEDLATHAYQFMADHLRS
ncbi:MAG: sugar phosphate isomerase/epimerase [Micrococcales bacterium]|nr:sugar phosphate isomerase/epimerase [Micrococcales bacterium]